MTDPLRPGLVTRVRAALRGERDAAGLEALRGAGVVVFEELARAERARSELAAAGLSLWDAEPTVAGHLVAVWNAFVLQSLGAGLLDADYAGDARTVGYVPPVTFEQAWSWFAAAEGWLNQARQARANRDYDLAAVITLPAGLPDWVQAEPCPPAHLQAMLRALPTVAEHAELALFDLEKQASTEAHERVVNRLRQLAAEAASAAEYAQAVAASPAGGQLHELIETHLKRAVALWFQLGQIAAMPALADRYRTEPGAPRLDPQSLPGGVNFDPWCLTDPTTVRRWRADPRARQAVAALWAADPDPARTLTIHAQIQAALADGAIVRAEGMRHGSYFYCCPWSAIYQVRRTVRIDGRQLAPAQQFTFDVSAEEIPEGKPFVRRILLGPFTTTTEVDYCDPTAGGHHDD